MRKDYETSYLNLCLDVLNQQQRKTRNATTTATFGRQLNFYELPQEVFPILQGRKIFWKGIVGEFAAFLKGPKNLKDFTDQGCNYWKPWADKKGNLNVDYGNAWIDFNGINQLKEVVKSLKEDPNSRRHLISSWRPDKLKSLSLPCCHYAYQWFINGKYLEMVWLQRSVDLIIGLPSDIILAALFNILMAQTIGLKPGKFVMQLGDCHIYTSHHKAFEQYQKQLDSIDYGLLPSWTLDKKATLFNFKPEMFKVLDYKHEAKILIDVIS